MSRTVTRPSIPPVVWFAAAVWTGIALGEYLDWRLWLAFGPDGPRFDVLAGVLTVVLALSALLASRTVGRHSIGLSLAVVLGAGVALGATLELGAGRDWRAATGSLEARTQEWSGIAVGDARTADGMSRFRVRLDAGAWRGTLVSVSLRQESDSVQVPELGARVRFRGSMRGQSTQSDWARQAHREREAASVRPWRIRVVGWRPGVVGAICRIRYRASGLVARVSGVGGDLIQGVVLGDRRRIRGSAVEQDFRTSGLSHLVAVSGTHLAVVMAFTAALLVRTPASRRGRGVLLCG
ncbi:MAG: ComEC/Rec2 family competence protein, partial [Actinomycetota bacterium]|nr:ComEC/Rec2 family competence protein [Actinomycetota bacterium]